MAKTPSVLAASHLTDRKVITISRELVPVHRNGSTQRAYDRAGVEIACAIKHSRAGGVGEPPRATRHDVGSDAMVDSWRNRAQLHGNRGHEFVPVGRSERILHLGREAKLITNTARLADDR